MEDLVIKWNSAETFALCEYTGIHCPQRLYRTGIFISQEIWRSRLMWSNYYLAKTEELWYNISIPIWIWIGEMYCESGTFTFI